MSGRLDPGGDAVKGAIRLLIDADCLTEAAAVLNAHLGGRRTSSPRTSAVDEIAELRSFLEESTRDRSGGRCRTAELHNRYVAWCEARRIPAMNARQLRGAMTRQLDYATLKNGHEFYRGLELRQAEPAQADARACLPGLA